MGGLRVKTEHCTAAGGLTAHRHTALNLLYTNTRVEQINTHTGGPFLLCRGCSLHLCPTPTAWFLSFKAHISVTSRKPSLTTPTPKARFADPPICFHSILELCPISPLIIFVLFYSMAVISTYLSSSLLIHLFFA